MDIFWNKRIFETLTHSNQSNQPSSDNFDFKRVSKHSNMQINEICLIFSQIEEYCFSMFNLTISQLFKSKKDRKDKNKLIKQVDDL